MLQEEAYSFYFLNRRSEVQLLSGPPNRLVKSDLFLISLVSTPESGRSVHGVTKTINPKKLADYWKTVWALVVETRLYRWL